MNKDIECIISPKSIAVVGATNRPGSVGLATFKNLLQAGYQGILYPVNPKSKSIQGVKAYPSLTDVPDNVDLAVIVVPAEIVPSVVKEAIQKQVKGCVVITAGFKEVGGQGAELEKQLQALVKENGTRLVGPNCLGVINTNQAVCMNASFARIMPKPGNIAFISQSGALCTAVLDVAAGRNIGFSKFVSFGNKADVNEIDLLRYLKDDPDTDVILMYIEDITDGREFIEVTRDITLNTGKPILAVKSGRSQEGARAAASHTGSLAGSDNTYDAIFLQGGIQRVEGVNELFNYAQAFSEQPLPKGNRVAIITNAGGPGIMATDAAIRHGLSLAVFSEATRARLLEHLPATASIRNPVDVIGDATHERYEAAIRDILMDDGVDGAIVILTPQAMTDILETARIIPHVAKDIRKPILSAFMGLVDVSEGVRYLEEHGIPNYTFPEAAARAMASMVRFGDRMRSRGDRKREVRQFSTDREKAAGIIKEKLGSQQTCYMPEDEATEILRCYEFPLLESRVVKDPSKLGPVIDELGFPVAMKIVSPDIIHKSDSGGVRLKIKSLEQARKAFEEIIGNVKTFKPDARVEGILVEQMAQSGLEVILGATRDPKFGPMCMFGLGGIFVEALKDVTFRLAPMSELSAENMIRSIKAYTVLKGIRGNPPADIEAIKDCILRLSQMVSDHPEIKELDINPLIVYPEGQGCAVADSRILLSLEER
ncbi:MAG TPA: acetate--CoA ligase family protein [Desulfobacterales bacterium]|nr:acetate--CoA ligase family protein [Desulfobacterales bacterium]